MHEIEYFAYGKFPDSERILGVGPRKESRTTIIIRVEKVENDEYPGYQYTGELEVDNEELRGKIVFERNPDGQPFRTKQELIDYLGEKLSITHMRDRSQPAVSTG